MLKPLPSVLLAFIGVCAAVIAGEGQISMRLFLIAAAVLLAAAGANGLTNYLDRDLDARMRRTCLRSLASGIISPPQKVLPWLIFLIIAGLALAWFLHPLALLADLIGTLVAATWRKKVTCIYPQGMIASCAPILMGWFAVTTVLSWDILLLCGLVAVWLPLHVWSVIIVHREEYIRAGLDFFPINTEVGKSVRTLLVFAVVLLGVSVALYFVGGFGWLYLAAAVLLGSMMVWASARLVVSHGEGYAWRLYKLSSFPYLGVIFLVMCLDLWLLA
ncbi:UbiA family prenyltransferase [Chloroflexota bacterium]